MHMNGRNGRVSNKTLDEVKEEMFDDEIPETTNLSALGIAIPINLKCVDRKGNSRGKLRCYVTLPAQFALKKGNLFEAIETLVERGYPLDFYQAKSESGSF